MRSDVERFLARFRRFGALPSVESYLALFHPDATLFDSGMPRPLTVPEIPEHIEGILKLVPDFRMTPQRSVFRAPTIFVEAHNAATLAGAPIVWASIYCIDLSGDRVIRGRRYYDRRPLFARLSPEIAARPAFEPEPLPIGAPMPETPIAFAALRRRLPDLEARLVASAGDAALRMREWELQSAEQPQRWLMTDRIDLEAGEVRSAAAYFDTLLLPEDRAAR